MIYDKEFLINFAMKTSFDAMLGSGNKRINSWKQFKYGNRKGYCHSIKGLNLGYEFCKKNDGRDIDNGNTCYYFKNFNSNNLYDNTERLLNELKNCTPRSHIIIVAHGAPNCYNYVFSGALRFIEYIYSAKFIASMLSHYLKMSGALIDHNPPIMGQTPYPRTLQITLNICDAIGSKFAHKFWHELKRKMPNIPFNIVAFDSTIEAGNRLFGNKEIFRITKFENYNNRRDVHRVNQNTPIPEEIKRVLYSWWNPPTRMYKLNDIRDFSFKEYKNQTELTQGIRTSSQLATSTITAANNYINYFNRLKIRGSWLPFGHFHGMAGRKKVSRLKELIARKPTIRNTSARIREFFNNRLLNDDNLTRVSANINANPHSFISFLLNEFMNENSDLYDELEEFILNKPLNENVDKVFQIIFEIADQENNINDFTQDNKTVNRLRKELKNKIVE